MFLVCTQFYGANTHMQNRNLTIMTYITHILSAVVVKVLLLVLDYAVIKMPPSH